MEAGWFLEREVAGLGGEGGDVMVVVEKQSHKETEGDGDKHPAYRNVPEVDKPRPVDCWMKCTVDGKELEVDDGKIARKMGKTSPEDSGQAVSVVREEESDPASTECRAADLLQGVYCKREECSDHVGSKAVGDGFVVKGYRKLFDTLDDVDCANVEGKRLCREVGHGPHIVAKVGECCKPVEDTRPDADPYYERWVQRDIV